MTVWPFVARHGDQSPELADTLAAMLQQRPLVTTLRGRSHQVLKPFPDRQSLRSTMPWAFSFWSGCFWLVMLLDFAGVPCSTAQTAQCAETGPKMIQTNMCRPASKPMQQ